MLHSEEYETQSQCACRSARECEAEDVDFLDRSRAKYGILGSLMGVRGIPKRKIFSYNKRTMDRAVGPF